MPELIASATISRDPLTVEMTFLRRGPSLPHFLEDHEGHKPGTVYNEYLEVWQRDSAEGEEPVRKTQLMQTPTHARYEYVDNVPAEVYDEDPEVKAATNAMDYIVSHFSFSFYRFKKLA